jgi:hypothetical protein
MGRAGGGRGGQRADVGPIVRARARARARRAGARVVEVCRALGRERTLRRRYGLTRGEPRKLLRVSCYARCSSFGNARGLAMHEGIHAMRRATAPAPNAVGRRRLMAVRAAGARSRVSPTRSGCPRPNAAHKGPSQQGRRRCDTASERRSIPRPFANCRTTGSPTPELHPHVHSVIRFPSLSLNSPLTSMIRSTSIQIPRPPRVKS